MKNYIKHYVDDIVFKVWVVCMSNNYFSVITFEIYVEIVHIYCVFEQVCAIICNHLVVSCVDLCLCITCSVDTTIYSGNM